MSRLGREVSRLSDDLARDIFFERHYQASPDQKLNLAQAELRGFRGPVGLTQLSILATLPPGGGDRCSLIVNSKPAIRNT